MCSENCLQCLCNAIFGRKQYLQSWALGFNWVVGENVGLDSILYVCKKNHVAAVDNMPGQGLNWQTVWTAVIPAEQINVTPKTKRSN